MNQLKMRTPRQKHRITDRHGDRGDSNVDKNNNGSNRIDRNSRHVGADKIPDIIRANSISSNGSSIHNHDDENDGSIVVMSGSSDSDNAVHHAHGEIEAALSAEQDDAYMQQAFSMESKMGEMSNSFESDDDPYYMRTVRRTSSDDSPESKSTASTKSSASDEELGHGGRVSPTIQEAVLACKSDSKRRQKRRPQTPKDITITHDSNTATSLRRFQLWIHGPIWTCIGIATSWAAVILLMVARNSSAFASLDVPIYIDPTFAKVDTIGIMNLRLCYNTTSPTDCIQHEWMSSEIPDSKFEAARILTAITILLGIGNSLIMMTSIGWTSLRLRPLGVLYLVIYVLHCVSFLFFDSDLCQSHNCRMQSGAIYSIIGSLCWILACVACARMDTAKHNKCVELERVRRRVAKYQEWFVQQDNALKRRQPKVATATTTKTTKPRKQKKTNRIDLNEMQSNTSSV